MDLIDKKFKDNSQVNLINRFITKHFKTIIKYL